MGDVIANWMLQKMPGMINFIGNLGETWTLILCIAVLVVFCGMYMMIDNAMNRTYHPVKKHHKAAKKHYKENVKKFIEYVKTADDEPYEDWMDYEKYIRTK